MKYQEESNENKLTVTGGGSIEQSQGNNLTNAQDGKPTQPGGDREDRTPNADGILSKASEEIQAFQETLEKGRDRYAEVTATRWVGIVQETPNLAISKFAQKIGGTGANPEHFRRRGREFTKALFGVVLSDDAK